MHRPALGQSRRHGIQGQGLQEQGLPDLVVPVLHLPGVFPMPLPSHSEQTDYPARVRLLGLLGCIEMSVDFALVSFCPQFGRRPGDQYAVAASMDMQLCLKLLGELGKDKQRQAFLVAETSISLAVAAVFQPLVNEKGHRAYSLPTRYPIGPDLLMLWLRLDMQEPRRLECNRLRHESRRPSNTRSLAE